VLSRQLWFHKKALRDHITIPKEEFRSAVFLEKASFQMNEGSCKTSYCRRIVLLEEMMSLLNHPTVIPRKIQATNKSNDVENLFQ